MADAEKSVGMDGQGQYGCPFENFFPKFASLWDLNSMRRKKILRTYKPPWAICLRGGGIKTICLRNSRNREARIAGHIRDDR